MQILAGATVEEAEGILRTAAPRFAAVRLRSIDAMTSNFVYRSDRGEIVRFPHSVWVRDRFEIERRLLQALGGGRLGVALPEISHFNADPVFMTYPAITGTVASKDVVSQFDTGRRARFGRDLGVFMARLHAQPLADLNYLPRDYGSELLALLADNAETIADRDPEGRAGEMLSAGLAAWSMADDGANLPVLLHQDLHGQNLICDQITGEMRGVQDFTLAWAGPAIWDFPEIYRCGPDILEHALQAYEAAAGRRVAIEALETLSGLQLCRSLFLSRPGSAREAQILQRIYEHA